jgi:predicted flap endonuclease-1-like 5' DNA nuclease
VFPIADVEQALAAALAGSPAPVTAADAEISRLKAQLRARDAYVVGIERALDEWTGQLSAAGIHNADDLAALAGRARGHAYRVAELGLELKQLAEQNAQLQAAGVTQEAAAKSSEEPPMDDESPLRRVRGIGRRYAKQLEALGIVHVDQIAAWTNADIARVAGELHIQPSRIKRECWIEQARALGSNARVKSGQRSASGRARQNHA